MQLVAEDTTFRQRFAALTEDIPQLVWVSHDGGQWTWASPRWEAYSGQAPEASHGLGWYEAVHPDDREATRAAWRRAVGSGVLEVEHRLLCAEHAGEARWFRTHGTPLPPVGEQTREWLGFATDVHEVKMQEERRRMLLDAMRHRVGNVLSITRSVARRTARASGTVEDYVLHLDGRLDAIARAHLMMMVNPGAGVGLEHLVADALRAHAAHEGEQVSISGPALLLRDKAAEWLSLAIHELAVNAVEHGALSVPDGRIEVTWRTEASEAGEVLRFAWLETNVPMPDASPWRPGFGTELIKRILNQELGTEASLDFGPQGVNCTIIAPMVAGVASLEGRDDPWDRDATRPELAF